MDGYSRPGNGEIRRQIDQALGLAIDSRNLAIPYFANVIAADWRENRGQNQQPTQYQPVNHFRTRKITTSAKFSKELIRSSTIY